MDDLYSDPDKIDDGIYFLGFYGTPKVLAYMRAHPRCKKEDFCHLVENISVSVLLEKLQKTGLVDEECTLTEKGRKLLNCLETLRDYLTG
jgi:hypothetical protein